MEPPDAHFSEKLCSYYMSVYIHHENGSKSMHGYHLSIDEVFALGFTSIRIRGGTSENPNADEKSNEIPYLRDSKFFWNGLPCIDFIEIVMFPLENGLASMSVKGYSLLDAVNQTDAGGILGNPARAIAPAGITAESVHRNKKAFACILNYVKRTSYFYKMAMREFQHDGIQVIRAMRNYGVMPLPPRIAKSREDTWQRMSMEVLRIPFDQTGYFLWIDIVYEAGRKLGKDGHQQLDKFIGGLPTWFNSEKAQMRHDTSANLMHPATWGGLYPGMPNGANAHPLANQPYIVAYGKKYFPDWCDKSVSAGKEPNLSVRSIVDFSDIDDASHIVNAVTVEDVTPKMKCLLCGGDEHPASIIFPDGTKHECLKRVIQKHKGILPTTNTLDGHEKFSKYEKRSKFQAKQIEELQEQLEEIACRASDYDANAKQRGKQHAAKQLQDQHSDGSSVIDDDEETSDSRSDSSHVHDMADAIQGTHRKKPFFKKRSS